MRRGLVRRTDVPARVRDGLPELAPLHHVDAYAVPLDPEAFPTIQDVLAAFDRRPPAPVRALAAVRDLLVRPLRLRRVGAFGQRRVGDDEFVFGGDDQHLSFRASVLVDAGPDGRRLVMSTLVHYNNRFGPVYFALVEPFHRLLVVTLLRTRFTTPRPRPDRRGPVRPTSAAPPVRRDERTEEA